MIFLVILLLWIANGNVIGETEIDTSNEIYYQSDPDVFFEIIHPVELEFTYRIKPAKDFGIPFNASFLKKRIGLFPTEPPTNCQLPHNADELKNNVALIQRGNCSFQLKTVMAEKAGAVAAIIYDYPKSMEEDRASPIWMDYHYIEMARDNSDDVESNINIPAAFLLGKNGRIIIQTLKKLELPCALINIPVNFTFSKFNEYRQPPWLLL